MKQTNVKITQNLLKVSYVCMIRSLLTLMITGDGKKVTLWQETQHNKTCNEPYLQLIQPSPQNKQTTPPVHFYSLLGVIR